MTHPRTKRPLLLAAILLAGALLCGHVGALVVQHYVLHEVSDGRLSWFPITEGSGTHTTDNAAPEHNATFTDASSPYWFEGALNSAESLYFHNEIGSVEAADPRLYDYIHQTWIFTISLWSKTVTSGTQCLVANSGTAGNVGFSLQFVVGAGVYGDYAPRLRIHDDGTVGTLIDAHSDGALSAFGNWRHIAVRSTGPGNNLSFFVDGAQVPTTYAVTYQGQTADPATLPMIMAACNSGTGPVDWLRGYIDDLRFYDRALSDAEIAALALVAE